MKEQLLELTEASRCPGLSKKVRIVSTALNEHSLVELRRAACTFPTLRGLEFINCTFDEAALDRFLVDLPQMYLTSLSLYSCPLSDQLVMQTAAAMQASSLAKLELVNCDVSLKAGLFLSRKLWDSPLKVLNLNGNPQLGAVLAKDMAAQLREHQPGLRELHLDCTGMGDEGAVALADALGSSRLELLSLDGNLLGNESVKAICNALPCSRLNSLSLGNNQVDDQGLSLLVRNALDENKIKLRVLDLQANCVTDEAMEEMALLVRAHSSLELLDLSDNMGISERGAMLLLQSIQSHYSMKELNLNHLTNDDLLDEIEEKLEALNSWRSKTILTLLSVKDVPRLGTLSKLNQLPHDLIRYAGTFL